MSISERIDAYLAGPALLRAAVAGMTRDQLLARPVPGKWSTLEVVCHIADFEPVYVDRMKRVIALDNPPLLGADESLFARHLAYHDRDLEEELRTVEVLRAAMARLLRSVPPAAFDRTGVHSERGPMSVTELLATITGHITHHVKFIDEKRAALK
jgi:uncharacterized damage-inducible protein DinB